MAGVYLLRWDNTNIDSTWCTSGESRFASDSECFPLASDYSQPGRRRPTSTCVALKTLFLHTPTNADRTDVVLAGDLPHWTASGGGSFLPLARDLEARLCPWLWRRRTDHNRRGTTQDE